MPCVPLLSLLSLVCALCHARPLAALEAARREGLPHAFGLVVCRACAGAVVICATCGGQARASAELIAHRRDVCPPGVIDLVAPALEGQNVAAIRAELDAYRATLQELHEAVLAAGLLPPDFVNALVGVR